MAIVLPVGRLSIQVVRPPELFGVGRITTLSSADRPRDAAFDLVAAQYASIPRTPDGRGVQNVMNGVAPGGTLLVVSHDLEPMRTATDTLTDSRAFDPDAYVRVEDFVAALEGSPEWAIEVHPEATASAGRRLRLAPRGRCRVARPTPPATLRNCA